MFPHAPGRRTGPTSPGHAVVRVPLTSNRDRGTSALSVGTAREAPLPTLQEVDRARSGCPLIIESALALSISHSHSRLGDELGHQIALDRLGAAFGAVAGVLDAAERHLG